MPYAGPDSDADIADKNADDISDDDDSHDNDDPGKNG